ncbi:CASP-like protein 1C1 [Cornus florida]|uniref:CASP-like protein 1C1 n=1 Tax=Cornus florida TaxID=4283 RepID=UPI00289CAB78|nr:CASP-like protein 1C1 [Cornus florida]
MAKTVFSYVIRILVMLATLIAAIVMGTSHKSVDMITFTFEAKISNWPVLKYFVIVNYIAAGYNLLVLFLPSGSNQWRLIVVLDMIMVLVIASGCFLAGEDLYIMKKGNAHVGWTAICGLVPAFCNRLTGALAVGSLGAIVQILLTLYTYHVIINPLLM